MRKSLKVVAFGGDPADTFLKAAGITDATITSAVKTLVRGLQADGLWSKMKAIYPMVGGNATAHSYNLKDISKFQITFSGGWTHSSNGALPNGTNGYGDTNLIPSSSLTLNSTHISCYTRTNTTVFAPLLSSENASTYTNGIFIWPKYSGNLFSVRVNDNYSDAATAVANTQGLHLAIRTNSNVKKYIHNTTLILSNTTVSSALNTSSIYIAASRNNSDYSTHQTAFASIGDGLTDAEASNLYTRIQTFQTTLNRYVGTPIYPSFDSDAQSFMTSASITDSTQQAAVNYLVTDLKANNLWTKMKALYPMVGGSATSHSYNLKDPAQFQITWSGGLTHSSTGVLPNGTNGYGNTGLTPSLSLLTNSTSVSFYSRTNTNTGWDFGSAGGSSYSNIIAGNIRYSDIYFYPTNDTTYNITVYNGSGLGYFIQSRTGASTVSAFKNSSKLVTGTSPSASLSAYPIFLFTFNNMGSPFTYGNKECAFFSIGDGLTDTDASNLYTIIQNYQTILSRQV
jgi:hypothetical protein